MKVGFLNSYPLLWRQVISGNQNIFSEVTMKRFLQVQFIFGLSFSTFYVFSKKITPLLVKYIMLFCAVYVNTIVSFMVGYYIIEHVDKYELTILPLWNIINAFIIFVLFYICGHINHESISNAQAKLGEIIFGEIALLIIFYICNYVYELYWAITFSIAVNYATISSNIYGKFFTKVS